MPSVASEVHQSLSARAHLPSSRPQPEADAPSTPFADLLDSTTPAAQPPAPRAARPDQTDRSNAPRRDDGKSGDAASSDQNTADTKGAKNGATDAGSSDGTTAKDAAAKNGKDGKAAVDADSSTDKPQTDADKTAVLDAMVVNAATPAVTAPHAEPVAAVLPAVAAAVTPTSDPAAATEAASEAGVIAALQTAGKQAAAGKTAPAPDGAQTDAKAGAKTDAKGEVRADKQGQNAAAPDPQAVAAQTNTTGKDGQEQANDETVSAGFRHAAADLLKKIDPDAPTQRGTDAAGAVKAGTDAMQNLGVATQTNAANATANSTGVTAANAPAQPQAVAVPLAGLAVEIATQANSGKNHFEIRLDPPELGRIDVRLDVDRDGNVSTRLIADRNDTLDMLKRDSAQLERALQDAGLKTSDNALQFSLRQQGFTHDDTPAQNTAQVVVPDDDPAPLEALRQGYGRLLGLGGGLDIRV